MFNPREAETAKKPESISKTTVQFCFYPAGPRQAMASIPRVEQAAATFFSPDPDCTNIFVIEAPLLPGLDIPHFLQELTKTGKHFEGYIQHTRTGFERLLPLSKRKLAKIRRLAEERVANHPYSDDENEQESLFFAGSLLMLDRLSTKRKFQLRIEPLTARGVARDTVKSRRALRELESRWSNPIQDSDAPLQTEEDWENFIEQSRQQQTDDFRRTSEVLRPDLSSFHKFLNDVIVWAVNGSSKTKIFVARPRLWQGLDHPKFQQQSLGGQKFAYIEPVVIPDGKYRHGLETLIRFIDNPDTETTRQEIIDDLLLTLIQHSLQGMGMESLAEERTLEFLQNSKPEERENVLFEIFRRMDERTIDSRVMLVDFFGEKVIGETYDGAWGKSLRWFAQRHERQNKAANLQAG